MERQFDKKCLSFISAIYSLTEFLLFISRAYEDLDNVESLHLGITLTGCKQRQLASFEGLVHLPDWYVSQDDVITWERDIQLIELRASYKDIACEIAMRIFHVFNWNDVSENMVAGWQDKLLSRNL